MEEKKSQEDISLKKKSKGAILKSETQRPELGLMRGKGSTGKRRPSGNIPVMKRGSACTY